MAKTRIKVRAQKFGPKLIYDAINAELLHEFEAQAPNGHYDVDIRKANKPKTHQQVKTHFGLLINSIIAQANDEGVDTSSFLRLLIQDDLPTGIGLNKDFLHQLFYVLCPTYDSEGRRITLSKMSIEEASKWFERCRNLLASRGFYVDDPNPNWRTK